MYLCNTSGIRMKSLVSFDMTSNYTVNVKGAEDITLKTTGNEKCNFTVVLCVTTDGEKFDSMVIFK